MAAGCEFFFLGSPQVAKGSARALALQHAPADATIRDGLAELRSLATSPGHTQMDLMRTVADECLRASALMSPEEMGEWLRLCSELDRKGSLFTSGVPACQGPFPRAWYRWLKERVARLAGRRG